MARDTGFTWGSSSSDLGVLCLCRPVFDGCADAVRQTGLSNMHVYGHMEYTVIELHSSPLYYYTIILLHR
jgi:hypothetical protein